MGRFAVRVGPFPTLRSSGLQTSLGLFLGWTVRKTRMPGQLAFRRWDGVLVYAALICMPYHIIPYQAIPYHTNMHTHIDIDIRTVWEMIHGVDPAKNIRIASNDVEWRLSLIYLIYLPVSIYITQGRYTMWLFGAQDLMSRCYPLPPVISSNSLLATRGFLSHADVVGYHWLSMTSPHLLPVRFVARGRRLFVTALYRKGAFGSCIWPKSTKTFLLMDKDRYLSGWHLKRELYLLNLFDKWTLYFASGTF